MEYFSKEYEKGELLFSRYGNGTKPVEYHISIRPTQSHSVENELIEIICLLYRLMNEERTGKESLVFLRLFLSDYINQQPLISPILEDLREQQGGLAISCVEQAPADGAKVNAWAYMIKDTSGSLKKMRNGNHFILKNQNYAHIWSTGLTGNPDSSTGEQTRQIFYGYQSDLVKNDLTISNNCIRTWLFVRDIDRNYNSVVAPRKKFFTEIGLSPDTHYIASTGIEGRHFRQETGIHMDSLAIGGLEKDQVEYIEAPDFLNKTHDYGVTFERATLVKFGDRNHLYVSGTASIDHEGHILWANDLEKQIKRIYTNINALMKNAGFSRRNIAQIIVYFRDYSDRELIIKKTSELFGQIPANIVHAAVCRPGWLVEMECMAIRHATNPGFEDF